MQSLLPTDRNHYIFGISYSAEDWARFAIGCYQEGKIYGDDGYKNLSMGSWQSHWNYRGINNDCPEMSPASAIAEMSDVRGQYVEHVMDLAKQLDKGILRLAKMEQEVREVLKQREIDEANK